MDTIQIIEGLLNRFESIRYVAIYVNGELSSRQKSEIEDSTVSETDKYEELLVNPTLLTLAGQRGNIDCGGLNYLIIRYGNFYQLVKKIKGGHISICLDKGCDPVSVASEVFTYLSDEFPQPGSN